MRSSNLALKPDFRLSEPFITRQASAILPTEFGVYNIHAFKDHRTGIEHTALVLGDINQQPAVLARVHSECLTGDVFGSQRCDCGEQFRQAQRLIQQQGQGIIVYLRGQEGRGIGLANKIRAYALQDKGMDTVEANLALGLPVDSRQYDIAAAILQDLQVTSIRLLSNNPDKQSALTDYGTDIEAVLPLEIAANTENKHYLATKKQKLGHQLHQRFF